MISKPLMLSALSPPWITLDNGSFIGSQNASVDIFKGIPFAKPPIGDLRLRLPVGNNPYSGIYNATNFGLACTQQKVQPEFPENLSDEAKAAVNAYLESINFNGGEDCLTINVWKPSNVTREAGLPVLVYIFGGGFEVGGSQTADGTGIVERSIVIGEPIIYVNFNYRLSAFGFIGGAEVKAAGIGNLGLQDQREALRWVHKYISAFGGNSSRVTITGQSAGAMSVGAQMLANDGDTEGLFHAAFMESGAISPLGDITNGQYVYDKVVGKLGYLGASDSLQCLREASFEDIKEAMDEAKSFLSPMSLDLVWTPRADGGFLKGPLQNALLEGKIADIPLIIGNCDDEGTFFSWTQTNVTTDNSLKFYIHSNYFPNASTSDLERLFEVYPNNVTLGSPFDTGTKNALTQEFKRLAAIQGDWEFFAPRRLLLQQLAEKQNSWVYQWKKEKNTTDFGSAHGFDLPDFYGPGDMTDYLIHFVNYLDPNGQWSNNQVEKSLYWPRYRLANPQLLTLLDGLKSMEIGLDNFRGEAIEVMKDISFKNPL